MLSTPPWSNGGNPLVFSTRKNALSTCVTSTRGCACSQAKNFLGTCETSEKLFLLWRSSRMRMTHQILSQHFASALTSQKCRLSWTFWLVQFLWTCATHLVYVLNWLQTLRSLPVLKNSPAIRMVNSHDQLAWAFLVCYYLRNFPFVVVLLASSYIVFSLSIKLWNIRLLTIKGFSFEFVDFCCYSQLEIVCCAHEFATCGLENRTECHPRYIQSQEK